MPGDVERVADGLFESTGGGREGDTEGETVLNGGTNPGHLPHVICKLQTPGHVTEQLQAAHIRTNLQHVVTGT